VDFKQYSTKTLVKTANDDNLTIEAVISTNEIDRDGESVRQRGIQVDKYMDNPLVLRNHDHQSMPIGKIAKLTSDDNQTIALIQFSQANPDGKMYYSLYKEGTLTSWSIGFKTLNAVKKDDHNELSDIELLEVSSVNLPANPSARAKTQSADLKCDICQAAVRYKVCSQTCSEILEKSIRRVISHEISQQTH